ncbi:hypothetical protein K227x_48090 [Rubripirellula lacrimiformis]|uniref:Acyl carrier protein phosphodiesterase n=1 Tax=Rubripirellula lacrimiformis TaxID=1930273 RepID=A0A517NGY7_9BACT|nr:hypothetical protein [Rubripirellula lacrimiformis]QDT06400.1 hypothetical protein K227x_48090 [Rubripirellula lacrimiformis]
MNFLCHAIPYFDQPLLAISTGIPDWMSVVDRKVRARGKLAAVHADSPDTELAQVASGILRHIADDRWFHGTEAFVETNLRLAVQLRDLLPGDTGFRPMFVGHILIEMLLDSYWIRDDPEIGHRYYRMVADADPNTVQRCVVEITGKPVVALAPLITRFCDTAFLYDYSDPTKLLMRLNQVMSRVGLSQLPESLVDWLAEADKLVESRRQRMLTPPDGTDPFGFGSG